MMLKRWALVTVALVVVLTATSVGTVLAQDGQQAALRFVHAVPGGPPVDVFVDGNRIFANANYKTATDYATFSAGSHDVRIVAAGDAAQGQAVLETTVILEADSYNTLAAVGQPECVQPLTLVNSSTLPVPTQSRVRAVHASPNAPAVDVAVRGGPVLFQGVTFPGATDYELVDAGTVNLEVREASTENVLLSIPNVALNGATVYSIFVVGLAGGQPPLEAVVVVDAPPRQACEVFVQQTPAPGAAPVGTPAAAAATATPQATGTPSPGTPAVTGTPTATAKPATPTAKRATATVKPATPTAKRATPTAIAGATPTTGGVTATVAPATKPPREPTPLVTPLFTPPTMGPTVMGQPDTGRPDMGPS